MERSGEGKGLTARRGDPVEGRLSVEAQSEESSVVRRGSRGLLLHRIGALAAVCGGLVLLVEAGPFSPEAGAALTTIDYAPRIASQARRLQDGPAAQGESAARRTPPAEADAPDRGIDTTGPSKAGIATIPWPEEGFEAAGSKLTRLPEKPAEKGPSFLRELPALSDTSLLLRRDDLSDEPADSGTAAFQIPDFDSEEPSFAFDADSSRSEVDVGGSEFDVDRSEFQVGFAAGARFGAGDASGWLQPIVPTSEEERYCLALTIYFEARGEPELGKLAVAHVVMNRVADQRFPGSICQVVRQGGEQTRYRCQFTWWCDGLSDRPANLRSWQESRALAESVYWGHTKDPTDGALWYHADYVAPRWAMAYRRTSQIGRHIFYQPTPQERRLAARRS